MKFLRFIPHYILWHYSRAIIELFGIITNFLWFIYHFFSIPILVSTLFSPWQKMGEEYKKGFHLENNLSAFFVNTMMRIVGFFIRGIVIIFGLIVLVITAILGIFTFILWLTAPVILVIFIISAVKMILIK